MYISTWPSLNPAAIFSGERQERLPFPLNARNQTRFFAARYGIYHLFKALREQNAGKVLVPAYHHGNEVKAIRAAGMPIRFYSIDRKLQPNLDEVDRLCAGDVSALYVIHYLGWPQPLDDLLSICRQRGVLLIEDCALSLLSESDGTPLGSVGEYSFFCLYKTVPVPNGGVLVQNRNALPQLRDLALRPCGRASVVSRSAELVLERVRSHSNAAGKLLFGLKRFAGSLSRNVGTKRLPIGNTGFDHSHINVGVSAISNVLLKHFDYSEIVSRRRSNYQLLENHLDKRASKVFSTLGEGVCPLFFPVLVRDKRASAEHLWSRGIGAVEFWNEGDAEATESAFPDSHYLRKHLLELPIHQDLSRRQIEYIANETGKLELL
jgi:dTDP-4-amino-4,6-dideoxygalactose transaminase